MVGSKNKFVALASSALLLALSLGGCATNPATGGSDFVLMSEQDELALGRKWHGEILKEYGYYDDEALQAYVQSVGEQVAKTADRPDLIYRFTVVDSPIVNAFALPGGYIYISRGLLAYLNSEAELAGVLGHELGHVTARHSVRQHSKGTAIGILGAVLAASSGVRGAGDIANLLGNAIIRGYGRSMELEADQLGADYLGRAGYRPQSMLDVIGVLKNQEEFDKTVAEEEGREPRAYHGVFATHPKNDTRLQELVAEAKTPEPGKAQEEGRERYLKAIDGLVFGDGKDQGIRRANHFYHGVLGFQIDFPEGWVIENQSDRIIARTPDDSARTEMLVEDLNKRVSPEEFIKTRLRLENLEQGRALALANGLQGFTAMSKLPARGRHEKGRVSVVYLEDRAYIFASTVKEESDLAKHGANFEATVASFKTLQEPAQAEPLRIRVQNRGKDDEFGALAKRTRIPNYPEKQLRLLNARYPDGELPAGTLIKMVE